jgi:uncharacterized membrane protein YccC
MTINFQLLNFRVFRLSLCLITGLLLTILIPILHPLWILITIITILFDKHTVGGTLLKAMMRVVATLVGGVIGGIVLIAFHNSVPINYSVIIIGSIILGYIYIGSKYSYVGLLGIATLVMTLTPHDKINSVVLNGVNLGVPITRISSIIIGAILSIIFIKWFFPQYAKDHIKLHIITSLRSINTLISMSINDKMTAEEKKLQIVLFETNFHKIFNKISTSLHEMSYETKQLSIKDEKLILHLNKLYHFAHIISEVTSSANNIPNMYNKIIEISATINNIIEQINNTNSKKYFEINSINVPEPIDVNIQSNIENIYICVNINRLIKEIMELIQIFQVFQDVKKSG